MSLALNGIALASLGILLLGIRLAAFFLLVVVRGGTFCALSFAVVFSVVGNLFTFSL